jgi:uncharacterized RDD family membrane protein YckC
LSKSATAPQLPFDPNESGTSAWKQEVNQKLAAHRNRRGASQEDAGVSAASAPRTASSKAAEAAARVAARYAKAPSYNQMLAGEARAAVRAAGAAAEAARHAQAAAQAVLAGLEFGPELQAEWESQVAASVPAVSPHASPSRWQDAPPEPVVEQRYVPVEAAPSERQPERSWVGAQPRWEEALPVASADRDIWSEMRIGTVPSTEYRHVDEELHSYDAVGTATVEPVQHLPANLIEFPRELTATRKARPRLAEGPLYDAVEGEAQLSIFEVDPELLAPPIAMSGPAHEVAPPEWASIRLDHHPEPKYAYHAEPVDHAHAYADTAHLDAQYAYASEAAVAHAVAAPVAPAPVEAEVIRETSVLQASLKQETAAELLVARMSDRLLASVVDWALVTLAYIAAAVVVIASTAHPPTGKIALIASGVGLVLFWLLYQFLFLSYAEEGTPGMRYARIALCTFCDDNPTREQMRMRIPAMVVAAVPAGLGLAWALFDGDHLGWHDRLTKTYQRKY